MTRVLLLVAALGCAAEAREPIPAVDLDPLTAQADRLHARRELWTDAAWACREACPALPSSLTFVGDRVECRCVRPNVGTRRVKR
jgi:hypothetical protein